MEELKKFQSATFDTIARRRLVEDQDTILELTGKIQEMQNEINCVNDWKDFQDVESIRSGNSRVTSRTVSLPPHPIPEGMLSRSLGVPSRREGPPSIWDTDGFSGNVFADPDASSSAPYSQELDPWSTVEGGPLPRLVVWTLHLKWLVLVVQQCASWFAWRGGFPLHRCTNLKFLEFFPFLRWQSNIASIAFSAHRNEVKPVHGSDKTLDPSIFQESSMRLSCITLIRSCGSGDVNLSAIRVHYGFSAVVNRFTGIQKRVVRWWKRHFWFSRKIKVTFTSNWSLPYQGGCSQVLISSKGCDSPICDWKK